MGPFRSIAKLNTWKGWLALAFLSALTIEATYASVGYGTTQPLLFSLIGGTVFALTARSRYYAVLFYCAILYVRTWIWAPDMGGVHLALGSLAMTISAALPNVVGALLFHRDEKNAIIDSPAQIARLFTLVLALYLISSAPLYYFFQSEFQTFWLYRMLVDCIGSAASVLLVGMFITYLITGQEFVVVQSRIPNYLSSLFFVLLPVGLWFFFSEDQQLTRFSLLLAVPAILYLASNFALFWVLLGLILHSVSISLATLFDVGPFYSADRFTTAVSVQGYMILVVLSAWVIALQRKSQKTAYNAIEAMNNHLEDIIQARTQELRHANDHLKREVELRNQAEELLRQLTLTDPVTELLNRQGLKQTFQSARNRYSEGAIVLISLENLQEIVENEGYEMADSVIRILAHRIERLVGRERVLARWDDSSFTILLEEHGSDHQALNSILKDISGKLGDPVALGPEALSVEALMVAVPVSALAEEDPDPMSDFFLLAASALQDLRNSDVRYSIASAQKDRSSGTGYKMYQQIKSGLQDGRFLVYYQPIVSANLDRLLGSEALIRWDNGGQLMGPDTFIAVAERTDLIVDLGYHTLEQVARKARQWNSLNLDIYSVNTSIRQLADPDFGTRCLSIWEKHGCSPSSLKIEITESILAMDHPTIRSNLEMLRKAGISIAFDDFGTGFSSLSYLDRFPVDSIKIDRVFVQKLSAGSNSRAVIEAMGLIAQQLELEVIVEGVEDETSLGQIRSLTPVAGWQGFLFSRPLPPEQFESYVRAYRPMAAHTASY